ncbi:MAG: GatB/YqeY domain-containing protein [Opitutaceae bacterium]|nr:GatB/YqeY domain-containing protein [Cytophagales bacterium]
MSLKLKIEEGIKKAMLAKDQTRLMALRGIKSQILLAETEKGAKEDLTEEAEMKLLTKAAKQRRDSLEIYNKEGRKDLAETEMKELAIIEEFLPKQMTDMEITAAIKEIIERVGAKSAAEIGKVMGTASKELAGKADGKKISEIAKSLLA